MIFNKQNECLKKTYYVHCRVYFDVFDLSFLLWDVLIHRFGLFTSSIWLFIHRPLMLIIHIPANISTLDQRCINVDPTLKLKQNPMSDFLRWTTSIQRRFPTLKQR